MTGKPKTRPAMALVRQIAAEEAAHANIRVECVFAKDRRRAVSWVRWRVCQRLRGIGEYSLTGIGNALNLDHTSVLHALKQNTDGPAPKLNSVREHDFVKTVLPWSAPKIPPKLSFQIMVPKSVAMGSGREWAGGLNRSGGDLPRESELRRLVRRFEG